MTPKIKTLHSYLPETKGFYFVFYFTSPRTDGNLNVTASGLCLVGCYAKESISLDLQYLKPWVDSAHLLNSGVFYAVQPELPAASQSLQSCNLHRRTSF